MIRGNAFFSNYRREASGSERQYASSATITNGVCYLQPLDGEARAVLDMENAIDAFVMTTEETNLQRTDKVTISGTDYFVRDIRTQHTDGAFRLTRLVIATSA
jgi:hypothetical protein